MKGALRLCLLAGVLLLPMGALAQGKLATLRPTFENTGHVPPAPTTPEPRLYYFEAMDVLALVAALSIASYLALGARSRRGLLLLSLLCLLYFGFWRHGCVCPVGSIQNVVQGLTDTRYAIPLTILLFFTLPLVFTLFFGRTFCAAVCPLGAIQDVVVLRPVKVPIWISSVLGLVPYVYLGLSLTLAGSGAGYLVCRYDPFVGFFRLSATVPMLVFGGGLLMLGVFVGRPYCRFLCPYGVLLNWCSHFARRGVTITPNECVQCRLCEDSCPFDAIRAPTPEQAPEPRAVGARRLLSFLLLLPVLVAGGSVLGSRIAVPLSNLNDRVQLAERLRMEESGRITETTVETDAYRRTKDSPQLIYGDVIAMRHRIGTGGWFLGGFVGLVVGLRLLGLSTRRRRTDFTPHPGECLSCARCFRYCPKEHERRESLAEAQRARRGWRLGGGE